MKILKKYIKLLLIIGSFIFASFSYAGCSDCIVKSIGTGPFYSELCSSDSCAVVRLATTTYAHEKAACSVNNAWHYVIDTDNVGGAITLGQLMTAHKNGYKVTVGGKGTCQLMGNNAVEDINYVIYEFR